MLSTVIGSALVGGQPPSVNSRRPSGVSTAIHLESTLLSIFCVSSWLGGFGPAKPNASTVVCVAPILARSRISRWAVRRVT